ncbi:hypothetical protein MUK42_34411 [Musa troglodytarum]|uniref:Uncharacterized protein n=1 Tax=Musa troglodytarum TaxID=320322 RepID=A0A9E7JBF1_9LILI|nr:hypothetical protein MUK42_34411 [Musa troglodytarum]
MWGYSGKGRGGLMWRPLGKAVTVTVTGAKHSPFPFPNLISWTLRVWRPRRESSHRQRATSSAAWLAARSAATLFVDLPTKSTRARPCPVLDAYPFLEFRIWNLDLSAHSNLMPSLSGAFVDAESSPRLHQKSKHAPSRTSNRDLPPLLLEIAICPRTGVIHRPMKIHVTTIQLPESVLCYILFPERSGRFHPLPTQPTWHHRLVRPAFNPSMQAISMGPVVSGPSTSSRPSHWCIMPTATDSGAGRHVEASSLISWWVVAIIVGTTSNRSCGPNDVGGTCRLDDTRARSWAVGVVARGTRIRSQGGRVLADGSRLRFPRHDAGSCPLYVTWESNGTQNRPEPPHAPAPPDTRSRAAGCWSWTAKATKTSLGTLCNTKMTNETHGEAAKLWLRGKAKVVIGASHEEGFGKHEKLMRRCSQL